MQRNFKDRRGEGLKQDRDSVRQFYVGQVHSPISDTQILFGEKGGSRKTYPLLYCAFCIFTQKQHFTS